MVPIMHDAPSNTVSRSLNASMLDFNYFLWPGMPNTPRRKMSVASRAVTPVSFTRLPRKSCLHQDLSAASRPSY